MKNDTVFPEFWQDSITDKLRRFVLVHPNIEEDAFLDSKGTQYKVGIPIKSKHV